MKYTRRKPKRPRRERIVTEDLAKIEESLTRAYPGRMFTKATAATIQSLIDKHGAHEINVQLTLDCILQEDSDQAIKGLFDEYNVS
jgi:hypothetical protein